LSAALALPEAYSSTPHCRRIQTHAVWQLWLPHGSWRSIDTTGRSFGGCSEDHRAAASARWLLAAAAQQSSWRPSQRRGRSQLVASSSCFVKGSALLRRRTQILRTAGTAPANAPPHRSTSLLSGGGISTPPAYEALAATEVIAAATRPWLVGRRATHRRLAARRVVLENGSRARKKERQSMRRAP